MTSWKLFLTLEVLAIGLLILATAIRNSDQVFDHKAEDTFDDGETYKYDVYKPNPENARLAGDIYVGSLLLALVGAIILIWGS